jgi:Skp family chaperone for outer membrane proteins
MKTKLAVTFLAVAAFVVGCQPAADKSSAEINLNAATEKVETKARETVEATKELAAAKKEYAYAQRAEFVTEKQAELAAINRDLETLTAKVEASSDAMKGEAKPRLQALRDQSAVLNKQLAEAGNATESTWDSVKSTSSKAYDDLKDGFTKARQWVSEKIAP